MICMTHYARSAKVWAISFYTDEGQRNDRKAEYFETPEDANNRVAELILSENMRYVMCRLEERLKDRICYLRDKAENTDPLTIGDVHRKEGALEVLRELIAVIETSELNS